MLRLRHKLLIKIYRILDQLILIFSAVFVFVFRPDLGGKNHLNVTHFTDTNFHLTDVVAIFLLLAGWFMIYNSSLSYTGDRFSILTKQLREVFHASTLSSFWLLLIVFVFEIRSITTLNVLFFWLGVTVLGFLARLVMRYILLRSRQSGRNYRYLLIVGANEEGIKLAQKIQEKTVLGYKIVGLVAETEEEKNAFKNPEGCEFKVLGILPEVREILKQREVDEIMLSLSADIRFGDVGTVLRTAQDLGVVLRVIPAAKDAGILNNLNIENFEGRNLLTLFRQNQLVHLLLKRLMDVVLSLLGLLFLSPILLTVAILIKLHDKGPIFFSQRRVGMNNRQFNMHKFRSMVMNAEELKTELEAKNERKDGPAFKMKNDPRVTPVGRILRKFSLDELPQLWNVVKGEMSLVGPRPPLPKEVDGYEWKFRRRLSIPQGCTCLWQISGRDDVAFDEWMDLDSKYIDNWSIWMDLKIIVLTIPAVAFGRGSS